LVLRKGSNTKVRFWARVQEGVEAFRKEKRKQSAEKASGGKEREFLRFRRAELAGKAGWEPTGAPRGEEEAG